MNPSDDGKVIGGKTVVWLHPPAATNSTGFSGGTAGGPARAGVSPQPTAVKVARQNADTGKAAAAALQAAAKTGVPFCEECEAARKAAAAKA
jgi:hypothetical protein